MPPKAKTESTELQVFNLDNLNPALLPELATFKEIQLQVVAENPFVAIVDVASRELAKKHRTARVSARTALQSQDKLISSKFNEAKTKAKSYIAELIEYTLPGELEQQKEINRDEAEAELKRQEKARIEQQRIDNIKKELEDYRTEWKNKITSMEFETIGLISDRFYESYTSFDTTILQEFEALFPVKVEELTQYLSDCAVSLTNVENARLENIRLEQEAAELRAEKARLEALAKIAIEAEAKAKAERVAFEKEKADFAEKQAIKKEEEKEAIYEIRKNRLEELGMIYSDEHDTFWIKENADYILLASEVSDWGAIEFEETFIEVKNIIQTAKDVAYDLPKTISTEKVEIPEILVPELPTVNVCTSEEILNIEVIDAEIVSAKPTETTWDDIEKDFKSSGEKSYSKWLKNNYNVPTKIQ